MNQLLKRLAILEKEQAGKEKTRADKEAAEKRALIVPIEDGFSAYFHEELPIIADAGITYYIDWHKFGTYTDYFVKFEYCGNSISFWLYPSFKPHTFKGCWSKYPITFDEKGTPQVQICRDTEAKYLLESVGTWYRSITPRKEKASMTIIDKGHSFTGYYEETFKIECPFPISASPEVMNDFKEKILTLYNSYSGNGFVAHYDNK